MKSKNAILLCLVVATLFVAFSCDKPIENGEDEPKYDIFENHDVSACGINDPLQNIAWLKDYCKSLKEKQDFSSVRIDLYKAIDTDEHFFKIDIAYSEFDNSPYGYTVDWRNCVGECLIGLCSGVPPSPEAEERYEEFLKDKEYIIKLFYFIKR